VGEFLQKIINCNHAKVQSMKNTFFFLALTVVLSVTAISTNAALVATSQPSEETQEQTDSRLAEIKQRVEEIRAMDKSQLSRMERKELRKELKNMKKEVRARGEGGVFISTAAIVAGILLIILILVLVL
jgi:Flp pilus assembly protein TadB